MRSGGVVSEDRRWLWGGAFSGERRRGGLDRTMNHSRSEMTNYQLPVTSDKSVQPSATAELQSALHSGVRRPYFLNGHSPAGWLNHPMRSVIYSGSFDPL